MLEIDQSSPEFALWQNVLHQANKDNAYYASIGEKKRTDFAGDFRSWKYFITWLMLHDYKPGMEVHRKNQLEPFTSKNCDLVNDGGAQISIERQAEMMPVEKQTRIEDIVVEGKTLSDIARSFGCLVSTVYSRLQKGASTIAELTYAWRPELARVEGKTLEQISEESGVDIDLILKRYRYNTKEKTTASLTGIRPVGRPGMYRTSDGTRLDIDRETNKRLLSIYDGIRDRCYNPKKHNYMQYGGRGIKMCDEWYHSFVAFREWAMHHGYRIGLSIDRINSDGNYEPSNCRWATAVEQCANRRGSYYQTLRLRCGEAVRYLESYPKNAIVTIIVRLDLMPPIDTPKEVDYET